MHSLQTARMFQMRLLKWCIGIVMTIAFFDTSTGWTSGGATSLVEEFALDAPAQTVFAAPGSVASAPAAPAASYRPDELHFEHRMAQERNKLYLCMMIGVVMIVGLTVALYFLTRTAYSQDQIVNTSGLAFIIFGTLYVVILADVEAQLTASTGILGAVAGYLFRAMNRVVEDPKEGNAGQDPTTPK